MGTPKLEGEEAPKLKDLLNELDEVKTKWRAIGRQLEVPESTLETIEKENKDDIGEALAKMLHAWEQKKTPSWKEIIMALRTRSVKKYRLADNLERTKCPIAADEDDTRAAGIILCCQ